MAFNFGPIKKAYGWICDCLTFPPRPIRSTDNTCYGIGGDGENPMTGLACTEPLVSETFIVLAQDPPRCFGGVGPCEPMPSMFRAVFPCAVPGSTCDAPAHTTGTSTSTGTGSGHTCTNTLVELPDNSTLTPRTPYQDCASCWILSTSIGTGTAPTISGPFGGLTSQDCLDLNSGTLCYLSKESSPELLLWGTACVSSNDSPSYFGPRPYDTYRRKWQLEYNTITQDWLLHSFAKIGTPIYTLHDTDPCSGNSKTLNLVSGTGTGGVGCSVAPTTVKITRGTNCKDACPSYNEPGCSVILSRYCNEDGYGLGSAVAVSAIPGVSHLCVPDRTSHHCCDVGCDYNGGSADSCPTQKFDYVGRTDPWVNVASGVRAWDFSPSVGTLTGTFIEGNIVYTVDSNGLQCNSVSVLVQTSTTLPDSIAVKYPPRICLVPDTLMTCDVRQNPPTETGTGSIPLPFTGPCYNAGYKHDTGHQDFCDCFDTCDPVILGSITVGNCASAPVCFARIAIKGQDPDAKSSFSRIGCLLVYDGEKFNALTQLVYCVGPGMWASDWYCLGGQVDDPFARDFVPCSAVIGSFLGTTYATKSGCQTFPFFAQPSPPLVTNKCVCPAPTCCTPTDSQCHVTVSSACAEINGLVFTFNLTGSTYNGVTRYSNSGPIFGFNLSSILTCSSGVWTLKITKVGSVNCTFTATSTNVVCSPHMSGTFSNGVFNGTALLCGGAGGLVCPVGSTFTAVLSL